MNQILRAKLNVIHFLLVCISAILSGSVIYMLGIPIAFFILFGEGQRSSVIESLPINMFIGNWGAVILVLLICAISLVVNLRQKNFEYTKSYLITMVIVFLLYLFRFQIGTFFIG